MEVKLFEKIGFEVNIPVAYSFTRRFADAVSFDMKEVNPFTANRYVLRFFGNFRKLSTKNTTKLEKSTNR